MNKLKILNSKLFFYYNYLIQKPRYAKQIQYDKNDSFDYEKFVSGFVIPQNSQIFIHAGLKSINLITGDKYDVIVSNLINVLKKVYNPSAIFTPSFTPSFRKTGVYSKNYSKGEYGVFSELPRHQADMRTDDAIHGVAIFTEDIEKFKNYNYHDTFSSDGFYASLKENTYVLNLTTNFFVSTYMHYIEEDLKVPYKKTGGLASSGIMYNENDQPIKITQNNHHYIYKSEINREKVRKLLESKSVLKWNHYLGLQNSCISVKDLDNVLREAMIADPYFLVSF